MPKVGICDVIDSVEQFQNRCGSEFGTYEEDFRGSIHMLFYSGGESSRYKSVDLCNPDIDDAPIPTLRELIPLILNLDHIYWKDTGTYWVSEILNDPNWNEELIKKFMYHSDLAVDWKSNIVHPVLGPSLKKLGTYSQCFKSH